MKNIKPIFKLWFVDEHNNYVFGEGSAKLLKTISETNDLTKAIEILNISYKKAWNLIKKINKSMNIPVVQSFRGGYGGGGGMILTDEGKSLLNLYDSLYKNIDELISKIKDN